MKRSGTANYQPFLWLGFLIILFINISLWIYLNQVERVFREELESRLTGISKLSREVLSLSGIAEIELDEPSGIERLYAEQIIEHIRDISRLQSVVILDPTGQSMASAPPTGKIPPAINIQTQPGFIRALEGQIALSGISKIGQEYFLGAFIPIQDVSNLTRLVLWMEVKAGYFSLMQIMRQRLLLFSILNTVLIITIALVLNFSIKRNIRFQSAIKDQEHLVQLGTMAASVAHELRNPLNIIDATGDLINRKYGRNDDEIFEFIPKEVQRLGRIIDDFLTFARGITPRPEELELSLLIKKIRLGFPENKSSALLFENRMARKTIQTDPDILEQILLNIIRNGMEAIPEGGTVNVVFESGPGEKMKILVADNGRGIDPVQRERIFEPFYTTKQQGTGLGLAITKRLIESLNGTIQINSQPGQGTRVEIYLPLS